MKAGPLGCGGKAQIPIQTWLAQPSQQALMDEVLVGIFRFARVLVTPFKEICLQLVLQLQKALGTQIGVSIASYIAN